MRLFTKLPTLSPNRPIVPMSKTKSKQKSKIWLINWLKPSLISQNLLKT